MKKKLISLLIVLSIVFGFGSVLVNADIEPNIVVNYDFNQGKNGWTVYGGGGTTTLTREQQDPYDDENYCLVLNNHINSWTSPVANIYDIIKSAGAGTYVVYADVMSDCTADDLQSRIVIRSNWYNSFIQSHYGNCYGAIGLSSSLDRNCWKKLTGSFKVLPSDITESSGTFNLCFDMLTGETDSKLYVDNVVVCKLNPYDITNGTFTHGIIGWRDFGGEGTITTVSTLKLGNMVMCGKYLKASTYGSIACNVDQIISNYGPDTYQVDFDLFMTSDSMSAIDSMTFYLTRGESEYHYYISSRNYIALSTGWQHISLRINTAANPSGQTSPLFTVLDPNNKQVYFRIQYNPRTNANESDETYYLTNFSFRPQSQANYVPSQALFLSNNTVNVLPGDTYQLNATLCPSNCTYPGISWSSSNVNVAWVSSTGVVTVVGKLGDSAVITAQSEDGVCKQTCTVTVYSSDPFDPSNIESICIKKYDCSEQDGDPDITTIVTQTKHGMGTYFESYAKNRKKVVYKIDDTLINTLNEQEQEYEHHPADYGSIASDYHGGKIIVDQLVDDGKIIEYSAEYYGIWASQVEAIMIWKHRAEAVIQLVCAAASAGYALYDGITTLYEFSEIAINTETTISSSQYISISSQVDELTDIMTVRSESNYIMLGTDDGITSWYALADKYNMSCFYSPNYNSFLSQYGEEVMQEANYTYLANGEMADKTFVFAQYPGTTLEQYPNSKFAKELNWLMDFNGLSKDSFLSSEHMQRIVSGSDTYYKFIP